VVRFRRFPVAGVLLPAVLSLMIAGCQRTGDPAPVVTGTAGNSAAGSMIVEQGDSPALIAKRYEVPLADLLAVNNLNARSVITPGQRLSLPNTRRYVVRGGDTLNGIARMFGLDPMVLARANNLQPPYNVPLGQALRLPLSGNSGTTVASAPPPRDARAPEPPPVVAGARRGGVETSALPPPTAAQPVDAQAPTRPREQVSPTPQPAPPAAQPQPTTETKPAPAAPLPIGKRQTPTPDDQPAQATTADQASAPAPVAKPAETKPAKPAETAAAKPEPPPEPVDETPPQGGGRFVMPVKGKLISGYGPKSDGTHNDGLNIAATKGTPVFAAGDGTVAYSGNELKGFGNLLLVRHADGWMTAYAHLDQLKAAKGDKVKRGQAIGTVGQTGSVDSPQLHFEVRKGSQPVDPNGHL